MLVMLRTPFTFPRNKSIFATVAVTSTSGVRIETGPKRFKLLDTAYRAVELAQHRASQNTDPVAPAIILHHLFRMSTNSGRLSKWQIRGFLLEPQWLCCYPFSC